MVCGRPSHTQPATPSLLAFSSSHLSPSTFVVGAGEIPGQAATVHAATSCYSIQSLPCLEILSLAHAQARRATQYSAQHMRNIAPRSVY